MSKDLICPATLDIDALGAWLGSKQGFWGALVELSVVGGEPLGTYKRPRPEAGKRGIKLKLLIGDEAPSANEPAETFLFKGKTKIQGQEMGVAAYRLNTEG